MSVNNGGPAHPLNWEKQGEHWAYGVTVRDYFAAAYAAGGHSASLQPKALAKKCYQFADMMLEARKENG